MWKQSVSKKVGSMPRFFPWVAFSILGDLVDKGLYLMPGNYHELIEFITYANQLLTAYSPCDYGTLMNDITRKLIIRFAKRIYKAGGRKEEPLFSVRGDTNEFAEYYAPPDYEQAQDREHISDALVRLRDNFRNLGTPDKEDHKDSMTGYRTTKNGEGKETANCPDDQDPIKVAYWSTQMQRVLISDAVEKESQFDELVAKATGYAAKSIAAWKGILGFTEKTRNERPVASDWSKPQHRPG